MIKRIEKLLKELKLDTYLIREEQVSSAELFFVKKALDMRRMKDVQQASVTVYRDEETEKGKMRGSSDALLTPDMDDEEMKEALQEAYASAGNALNPWFSLYEGKKEAKKEEVCGSITDLAMAFSKALFDADVRTDAFMNSAEFFAEKEDVHIVSSEGTDVSYVSVKTEGEFVVQCKEPRDVEQHFSFEYNDADTSALYEKAKQALNTVADRARAEKAPKAGNYNIILSGENVSEILSLYLFRANAAYVYSRYSNYETGMNIQGETDKGEALKLSLLPREPYSGEGIPMTKREFVKDGVLQFIHGNNRFCKYLGIEPTGMYEKVACDNGTVPFDEMKQGCLYPVSFSDFQMDPFSGHFMGEMRLAYYYGENGVEILTGGSINGSLLDRQQKLVFSGERYKDADYEGPLAVRIDDVAVAG